MTKHKQARHAHRRTRLSIEPKAVGGTALTSIRAIGYGPEQFFDEKIDNIQQLNELKGKSKVLWVDVQDTDDHEMLRKIGESFDVHRLALEDVINAQRPKLDQYGANFFLVLQHLALTPDLVSQQISIAISEGCVITFHEGAWKGMEPIVDRIRNRIGSLRDSGADYLVYAISDSVIDSYFPILEVFGEQLESLEAEIIDNPNRQTIGDVHVIKRELLIVRRAMWPMREAINSLLRDGGAMFKEDAVMHLRDCYDHCVQIIDFIETYRELGADLMDVYLSSISNRMNEVMKVLTIITTIFVPPTFIAGVYGMNFRTEVSPYNMPELSWYYGYPACLLLMFLVAISVLGMLMWKGWLSVLTPIKHRQGPLPGANVN